MDVVVRTAVSEPDLDEARRLFREFLAWHRGRAGAATDRLDAYFDEAAWEAELAGLPAPYAGPSGALLLAWDGPRAVGVVGVRRLDETTAEMKRMYVADRGRGTGRLLGAAAVEAARELGYQRFWLDTGPDQVAAIGLYRSLGFTEIAAYHDVPDELEGWLLFFGLEL